MKFIRILTIYIFNCCVTVSHAMTRAERICRLQAISGSSNSNQQIPETSTPRQQTENSIHENLQPFGSGLFRRKRFMAMVPQNTQSTSRPDLVRDRSTCPWVMVLDYDNTRFPRLMERAVCLHNNGDNRCDISFLNADMDNMTIRHILTLLEVQTECALVYAKVNILKECCENGNYTRRPEVIDWPVACTCAKKRMVSVTPANTGR